MDCIYCGTPVPEERYEIGYAYCVAKDCVSKSLQDRTKDYRLILMPKQGFTYVTSDSPDLLNGKSSGR